MRELSEREKVIVAAGGAAVLLALVWLLLVAPLRAAWVRADARIEARQQLLTRLEAMAPEVTRLRQAVRSRGPQQGGLTPLAAVEDAADRAGIRAQLASLRPVEVAAGAGVEARLEKVRLDQAVRWLFLLEQGSSAAMVTQLRLRPRFEEPTLLDVAATLAFVTESAP